MVGLFEILKKNRGKSMSIDSRKASEILALQKRIKLPKFWTPPRFSTDRLELYAPVDNPRPGLQIDPRQLPEGLPSNWSLFLKGSEQAIGSIGYIRWDRSLKLAEIGFILAHAHRGLGYMTEACRAVIKFGFLTLQLEVIEGRSLPNNQASITLLKRIGMKKEERVQTRLFSKGDLVDLDIYRLRKKT